MQMMYRSGLVPRITLKLLCKLLLLAQTYIFFTWMKKKSPTLTQWYKEMFKILP